MNMKIVFPAEKTASLELKTRAFIEAYNRGVDSWVEAGRIVAEEISKDSKFPTKIAELTNGKIPAFFVRRLASLGRGEVIPEFALDWDRPGIRKLVQLPASVQRMYYTEHIPVVVSGGDILNVDPMNMTKHQEKQVFEGKGDKITVRTSPQQRCWIEDQKMDQLIKKTEKSEDLYFFSKGKIIFNRPCNFNLIELLGILAKEIKVRE
jgi:hypothetical protein